MGKNIILLIMATSVLVILVSGESKGGATSKIIKAVGGTGSNLIAALQGRPAASDAFG